MGQYDSVVTLQIHKICGPESKEMGKMDKVVSLWMDSLDSKLYIKGWIMWRRQSTVCGDRLIDMLSEQFCSHLPLPELNAECRNHLLLGSGSPSMRTSTSTASSSSSEPSSASLASDSDAVAKNLTDLRLRGATRGGLTRVMELRWLLKVQIR